MKHCISCGKKGVRWPKEKPECCSQRCAAFQFLLYADAVSDWEGRHCEDCGKGCQDHEEWCLSEEEEA